MADSKAFYAEGQARPGKGRRRRAQTLPGALLDRMLVDVLAQDEVPRSAYELASRLRDLGQQLPAMSVYRGLDRLAARGLIEKVEMLSAYRIRDKPHAILMICLECGRTTSIAVRAEYEALRGILADHHFSTAAITIEASGRCALCAVTAAGGDRT